MSAEGGWAILHDIIWTCEEIGKLLPDTIVADGDFLKIQKIFVGIQRDFFNCFPPEEAFALFSDHLAEYSSTMRRSLVASAGLPDSSSLLLPALGEPSEVWWGKLTKAKNRAQNSADETLAGLNNIVAVKSWTNKPVPKRKNESVDESAPKKKSKVVDDHNEGKANNQNGKERTPTGCWRCLKTGHRSDKCSMAASGCFTTIPSTLIANISDHMLGKIKKWRTEQPGSQGEQSDGSPPFRGGGRK